MADRYWVGGTGTWDASSTAHWSSTSGGSSGASVPTLNDNVYFDTNSGGGTITINATSYCHDFTMSTGFSVPNTGYRLEVYGNISIASGVTWAFAIDLQAAGTATVNIQSALTIGVAFGGGPSSVWNLANDLTCGTSKNTGIWFYWGTLNTNGYTITSPMYFPNVANSGNTSTKTLNLGSSTINATNDSQGMYFNIENTNVVVNPGTSTINVGYNFSAASSLTFYNVSFNYNGIGYTSSINLSCSNCTFNNLTFNNVQVTNGLWWIYIAGNNTITGTLSCIGTDLTSRLLISNVLGFAGQANFTRITLTVGTLSMPYCDFKNIAIAGSAAGTTITGGGDCGNNSGINFPASKTVYWNYTPGTGYWYSNGWATSSGGSPNSANFPLPQDTAIIDNNSAGNLYADGWAGAQFNLPSIDASSRTTTFYLYAMAPYLCGSLRLGTGIIIQNGGYTVFYFQPTRNSTILNNGRITALAYSYMIIQSASGTSTESITLEDDLRITTTLYLVAGTLNINGFTFTTPSYAETTWAGFAYYGPAACRTINFGTNGTLALSTAGTFNYGSTGTTYLSTIGTGSLNLISGASAAFYYNADFSTIDLFISDQSSTNGSAQFGINGGITTFKSINNTTAPCTINLTGGGGGGAVTATNFNLRGTLGAEFTGTCSGSTLTVSSVTIGALAIGMYVIYGTSNTGALNIGKITSGSGSTWTVDAGTTISSPTSMRAVNMVYFTSDAVSYGQILYKTTSIVKGQYLRIHKSFATGSALWYAGKYSINAGTNSGWIWGDPSNDGEFLPFLMNVSI